MMTNDAMPMTTAPDSSSPWTDLFNQLGPALIGGAGTFASGKQLQGYTDAAVNAAGYKPTTIAGPGGGITPTRNPDGSVSYGVTGTGAPALGPLSQFAGGAAGAGSDVLSAFKNFNPQQFAQDQYTNLASLQAPTNTNQTQQMLNYEQRTGRGGLTQNGQLGDLGGLDLSQRLGDTGLRMQAEQLASQRQGQLADTASRLGGAGTTALGGVSNYNSSLMDMLRTAMTGSTSQAYAGANQGRMMYDTGTARANQTGNLFGSTLQGLANSGGGLGSSLGSIFNSLRNSFGGSNSSLANYAKNWLSGGAGSAAIPGFGALTAGDIASGAGGLSNAAVDASLQGYADSSMAGLDGLFGPSAAGGEAAAAGGEGIAGVGGGALGAPGIGAELAGGEFGIPLSGAAGAGAGLGAMSAGDIGAGAAGLSDAAVESGLQAGTTMSAADAAAVDAASTGAEGAGAMSGLGAAMAPAATVALAMAPVIAGMRSSPVSLNSDYWNRFRTGLFNGTSGNSTYDQYTSPTYQKTAATQNLYNMIQQQSLGQGGSMSGSWNIPSDLMAWAKQQGMLNKGYVPPSTPALITIGGRSRGGGGQKL